MASTLDTFKDTRVSPRSSTEISKLASLKEAHLPRVSAESGIQNGSETPPSIAPETKQDLPADFKPSTRLYVAFLTLAVITLMVALDGTSLSVALPVSSECQCVGA